jgi:hypothetical protein
MKAASAFQTTTRADAPLDASGGAQDTPTVSDFLTIQSLTNFAAMTGAITAAWHALQRLDGQMFSTLWVPYGLALFFGIISIVTSLEGLKKGGGGSIALGTILGAIFIALMNALVLASAVVGAGLATGSGG